MRYPHGTTTTTQTPTDPMPTSTEEGWLRRYNERPQDTAVGRAEIARMLADSDAAVWGSAA